MIRKLFVIIGVTIISCHAMHNRNQKLDELHAQKYLIGTVAATTAIVCADVMSVKRPLSSFALSAVAVGYGVHTLELHSKHTRLQRGSPYIHTSIKHY